MLDLKNIKKTFNAKTVNEKAALNGLSLRLNDSDFVTVIGGNGAGKSTMLNAIAGVWPIDQGSIVIDGVDISRLPEHRRAPLLGRVFQDPMTGTAVTAIDRSGAFVGGCICPGVKISAEALSARTAQLPAISLESTQKVIGKNTVDAMRSGVMLGAACMIDGLVERMQSELGGGASVVATGGISRFVLPMCRHEIAYDRDLLLKGLYLLYENNKR